MNISIAVKDDVTPAHARVQRALTDGTVETVIGRAVTQQFQRHFRRLAGERHHSGASANFYTDAARSTTFTAQPREVVITVAKIGMAQRFYGGPILPVRRKYLTIPATEEAYGKRAGEFSNLRFGFAENRYGNLAPALVKTSASLIRFGRKKKDGTRTVKRFGSVGGEAVFFLVKKVFQRADPSVLPEQGEVIDTAAQATDALLTRLGGKT